MADAPVGNRPKDLSQLASELWELVVTYAKQETVDPIKRLGRFVAFGILGSFLLGLGLGMAVLALLRALQTETGSTFTGSLSWGPYGLTAVLCIVFVGIALAAIGRGGDR